MDPNNSALKGLFKGFNTSFNKGLNTAKTFNQEVAMRVTSTGREETYGWMADMPKIREWIGDRNVHNLQLHEYTILNRLFESTVVVSRTVIEDDEYGTFGPILEKMGRDTAVHPDDLVFTLMAQGFNTRCFDGQYFFDTDHPVVSDGNETSVSNMQAGAETPWYLLDCSQPIKPMIYQERMPFEFTEIDSATDGDVFYKDRYTYGVRGRSNAGFGLWQLAFASKAVLNAENYEIARSSMQSLRNDSGKPLRIMPTHLVVPPTLEGPARRLLKAMSDNGSTNEWAGSAELIVSPFL